MMKKVILLLCALVMTLAFATAEAPVPTAEPPALPLRAAAQDTVTAVLRLNAPVMGGMQAQLKWDPLVLELAAVPAFDPAFQREAMIAMLHPDAEKGTLNLVYLRQDDAAFEDTVILTLTFRVKDDALAGETAIQLGNLLLTNTAVESLPCEIADACITIVSDIPTPTPTLTPEPTPETTSPEPSATPELTPEPTEEAEASASLTIELQVIPFATPTPQLAATPAVTPTPRPAVTSTPVPTATPPSSHTGGSISSGTGTTATPTPKPTATPSPTPITLGGSTPVPQSQANLYLRTRQTLNGFAVDLMADGVIIGGLQACISYNAETAVYEKGAFTDAFAQKGMMSMINDSVPGQLKLVYSSLEGYEARESLLFTAEFRADLTEAVSIELTNVKITDASAQLNTWVYADQQYTVQPMDDLKEADGLPASILHILPGQTFTCMFNAGETIELLADNVVWTSCSPEVVAVTTDGMATAIRSGAAVLIAQDAATGEEMMKGTLCVRDRLTGIPLDIRNVQVYSSEQAVFGLLECAYATPELAQRGLRLIFRPSEETLIVIDGVLPPEMTTLPSHAFLGCGSLTDIDVLGAQITAIDDLAFDGCPSLQTIYLYASVTALAPDALHCDGPVTFQIPAGSYVESFILQHPELNAVMEVFYE